MTRFGLEEFRSWACSVSFLVHWAPRKPWMFRRKVLHSPETNHIMVCQAVTAVFFMNETLWSELTKGPVVITLVLGQGQRSENLLTQWLQHASTFLAPFTKLWQWYTFSSSCRKFNPEHPWTQCTPQNWNNSTLHSHYSKKKKKQAYDTLQCQMHLWPFYCNDVQDLNATSI